MSTPDQSPEALELRQRKYRIEATLIDMGIKNYRIAPALSLNIETFQSPYDAGCRMLILYAISYASHNPRHRADLVEWLKAENLWNKVSPQEQAFFTEPQPAEDTLQDLSWRMEGVLTLAWALNLVPDLHEIDQPETDQAIDELFQSLPAFGDTDTHLFLNRLNYRDPGEILEENLVNEAVTTYFRGLRVSGQPNETQINPSISAERHFTLNWLRKFSGIEAWDDTDIST
jgi:hypothetical protein